MSFLKSVGGGLIVPSSNCPAAGVFTMLFSQSLYVYGLQRTTATNSATLHLAIPVWYARLISPSPNSGRSCHGALIATMMR